MPDPPTAAILTVNSGSSSIKFTLYTSDQEPAPIIAGALSGIGTPAARLSVDAADGVEAITKEMAGVTHAAAAPSIMAVLKERLVGRTLSAVVHRIVHGGERFDRTQTITPEVIVGLTQLIPLAPNHLPDELALIAAFGHEQPDTPQVACFDTAFHHDLPAVAHTLPVPPAPGLRRYGFHGLSYAYLLGELEKATGGTATRGRIVLAHLGSGASLAAVKDGRCVDTSMGLTPTGGVVMSSRSGDLDPGVVTYLARRRNLPVDQLDDLLTQQSGLLGISGSSADMRELLADQDTDPRARLAVDIFCYQIKKWIGAFTAALGGLDTLVFAGGIGEQAPGIRDRICDGLAFLGLQLDATQNAANARIISTATSQVSVRVIPTDEALMMAREARALLMGSSPTD